MQNVYTEKYKMLLREIKGGIAGKCLPKRLVRPRALFPLAHARALQRFKGQLRSPLHFPVPTLRRQPCSDPQTIQAAGRDRLTSLPSCLHIYLPLPVSGNQFPPVTEAGHSSFHNYTLVSVSPVLVP